jgi:hypothetical protein
MVRILGLYGHVKEGNEHNAAETLASDSKAAEEPRTHCWKISQCENTQQGGLSTCAVTNNDQFPMAELVDVR